MPFLIPFLVGGTGFGLGFWAGDGFSSLVKIALLLALSYIFYRFVM